ncbi:MAG: hypothetical protein RR500_02975 [Bacilli bacterium]
MKSKKIKRLAAITLSYIGVWAFWPNTWLFFYEPSILHGSKCSWKK